MSRHFTTVERLVHCDFVGELVVIVLFAREVLRQQLAGMIDRDNKARTGVPQVGKSAVELGRSGRSCELLVGVTRNAACAFIAVHEIEPAQHQNQFPRVTDTPALDGCFQQVCSEVCSVRDVVRHPRNQNDARIYSGDRGVSGERLHISF